MDAKETADKTSSVSPRIGKVRKFKKRLEPPRNGNAYGGMDDTGACWLGLISTYVHPELTWDE